MLRESGVNMGRYQNHKANKSGKLCVTIIVLALAGIMSVQIVNLYKKDRKYAAQEASLKQQEQEQLDRQKELQDYEAYTQTQEYVEDTAKSKLGMVYDNEVIFKEQ